MKRLVNRLGAAPTLRLGLQPQLPQYLVQGLVGLLSLLLRLLPQHHRLLQRQRFVLAVARRILTGNDGAQALLGAPLG